MRTIRIPIPHRDRPWRLAPLAARMLLFGALAFAMSSAPGTALAKRAPSDEVAGARLSAGGVAPAAAPDIEAAAGALVDADGEELWSRAGDRPRPMASTTKMMTALLAIEHGGMNEMVTVSKAASRVPYGLGLKAGERVRARKLLELTLVASSNDAAYALGEHVGGDMRTFVGMMNRKAAALGLEDTHFANPHGLDAPGHYSSPADLAALAQKAMGKPAFRRAVGMRSVKMPAYKGRAGRTIKSTDKLLGKYKGLLGVKTGFTGDAGYSFVASAKRGGITLTAVILGARSGSERFSQSARLLDWGFKHLKIRTVATAGDEAGEVPVAANPEVKVPVRLAQTKTAPVFALGGKVTRRASLPEKVDLPVLAGQRLGEVSIVQGDRVLARVAAITATTTVSARQTVAAVPVSDYVFRTVTARTAEVTSAVPAFDPAVPIEQKLELTPEVAAPVAEGAILGRIVYAQGDSIVRVPVVAAESVEPPGFLDNVRIALLRGWRSVVGGPQTAQLRILGQARP